MENKEIIMTARPMKWFAFYKVLLIIWTAGYFIYGIGSAILAIAGSQELEIPAGILVLMSIVGFALGALCLYLFIGLRKFSLKAYKVNMWFTVVLGLFGAAGSGAAAFAGITGIAGGFGLGGAIVLGVVTALIELIYPLCSIIYFEKRKFMFGAETEEDSEEAEVSADSEKETTTEGKAPAEKSAIKVKYIIAHSIVSIVAITLAIVLVPAEWSQYDDDYMIEYDYGLEMAEGQYEEAVTDEADITAAFDDIAVYMGYIDADELMTDIEYIEEVDYDTIIDLHAMDQKEAYQYIFTEYFAVSDYESALFAINPYTEEVITSFGDYQDYVRMEVELYYELYEDFEDYEE